MNVSRTKFEVRNFLVMKADSFGQFGRILNMNSMLFETKQLCNCTGTKRLNCVGTNRPSWVRIVWERNVRGYKTSGKRLAVFIRPLM